MPAVDFYFSSNTGVRFTVTLSVTEGGVAPVTPVHERVKVACCVRLPDETPPAPENVPEEVNPLVPVTEHDWALLRSQNSRTGYPERTRSGRTCRWPLRDVPFESVNDWNVILTPRQVEMPGEQYCGETQVVTLLVEHDAFVYWIVLPEHEYAGVQATVTVLDCPPGTVQFAVPPAPVAVPANVVVCEVVVDWEPETESALLERFGIETESALAEVHVTVLAVPRETDDGETWMVHAGGGLTVNDAGAVVVCEVELLVAVQE